MTGSGKSRGRRHLGPVAIAGIISFIWLAGSAVMLATLGGDGALWLAVAVAVALPLVAIWFAALLARQSLELHDEAERITRAAEEVRETARIAAETAKSATARPPAEPMRLAASARPAPAAGATAADVRSPAPHASRQTAFAFSTDPATASVAIAELVLALDFPESPEDEEGFRALRLALGDPRTRRLVQASQDVLTLLSEDGIYMDDLTPDRAPPETWRRFAGGERGAAVGKVGGIRDRSSLALTAARMRADPVFRDAAHHFLRLFDKTLSEIGRNATDTELVALAETRTARAFMLLGRVTGVFE